MVIIRENDLKLIQQRVDCILKKLSNDEQFTWIDTNSACKILEVKKSILYYHSVAGNIGYSVLGSQKYYKSDELIKFKTQLKL